MSLMRDGILKISIYARKLWFLLFYRRLIGMPWYNPFSRKPTTAFTSGVVLPNKGFGAQKPFRTQNFRPLAQQVDELGRELINAINMKKKDEVNEIIRTATNSGDRVLLGVVNYTVDIVITPLSAAITILDPKNPATLSILITLLGNGANDPENKGKDALAKCFIELIRTTKRPSEPDTLIKEMDEYTMKNYVVNAQITYNDDPQYTALKAAAERGMEYVVPALVRAGAKIDAGIENKRTALTYTIDNIKRDSYLMTDEPRNNIAAYLIKLGANVDVEYVLWNGIKTTPKAEIIKIYNKTKGRIHGSEESIWKEEGGAMWEMCQKSTDTRPDECVELINNISRRGGRRTRKHKKRSKKTRRVKRRVH